MLPRDLPTPPGGESVIEKSAPGLGRHRQVARQTVPRVAWKPPRSVVHHMYADVDGGIRFDFECGVATVTRTAVVETVKEPA
jgi:hypothetical protein